MKKAWLISTFLFQFFITAGTLFCIYMLFAILDNEEVDMISEIGLLTIQPVFAIILTVITIAVCTVVGLPIRLNKRLNKWWVDRPFITIFAGFIGLTLLLLSLSSKFTEQTKFTLDGEEKTKEIPNTILSLTGWFLTAFSLLHFYPLTIFALLKNKFRSQKLAEDLTKK